MSSPPVFLRAVFDYEYEHSEGKIIQISKGDEYILIHKSNADWYYVKKSDQPTNHFYVPSAYVEEVHKTVISLDSPAAKLPKKPAPVPSIKQPTSVASTSVKQPVPLPSAKSRQNNDEEDVLKQLDGILDNAEETPVSSPTTPIDAPMTPGEAPKTTALSLQSFRSVRTPSGGGSPSTHKRSVGSEGSNSLPRSNPSSKSNSLSRGQATGTTQYPDIPPPDYDTSTPAATPSATPSGQPTTNGEMNNMDSGISEGSNETLDKDKDDAGTDVDHVYMNACSLRDEVEQMEEEEEDNDYANADNWKSTVPEKPPEGTVAIQRSSDGWEKYLDGSTNKPFFYHPGKGISQWDIPNTWKPLPTNRHSSFVSNKDDGLLTTGWRVEERDDGVYYIWESIGEEWQRLYTDTNQVYFYNHDSNESAWALPQHSPVPENLERIGAFRAHKLQPKNRASWSPGEFNLGTGSGIASQDRKQFHLEVDEASTLVSKTSSSHLLNSSIVEEDEPTEPKMHKHGSEPKKGPLNRKRIMENGKKVKKSWQAGYAILQDTILYLYKDEKSSRPKPGNDLGKPEMELNLEGGKVEFLNELPDLSKRKNLIQVETSTKTVFIFHTDDSLEVHQWLQEMKHATFPPTPRKKSASDDEMEQKNKKSTSNQGKKNKEMSAEAKKTGGLLHKLLSNRTPVETLRLKGIYKDEAVFGNTIDNICTREKSMAPRFVTSCIAAIEKRGLETDGLYRISGNMAQIQKLRLLVDSGDFNLNASNWEIHVLTGALKLFFRELQAPLIAKEYVQKILENASKAANIKERVKVYRDILCKLPIYNRETFKKLMEHLVKVVGHSQQNRMQHQNLAIIFGPTLLSHDQLSDDLALSMMHVGQMMEFILTHYDKIFT